MHKITSLILTLVVVLVGLLPSAVASAAETGTSTGSFSITNVAPVVTVVETYTDVTLLSATSTLTPQVTYYAKVTVSDANTLDDITQVKLKIFYDSDNSTADDESSVAAGSTNASAIITWLKTGNVTAIDAGVGTTWSVNASVTATPTMTDSSGDWVFTFKVGKVATESIAPAKWVLHARAYDIALDSGLYNRNKDVLWYGEIAVGTSSVSFGSLVPGTGFGNDVNEYNTVNATWTANGDFDEKVKSTATWNGTPTNNATLDPTGAAALTKEFALKAWSTDAIGSATSFVDTIGVLQYTSPHARTTTDVGETTLANTLWLKLNGVFPLDTYSGTITYIIANAP